MSATMASERGIPLRRTRSALAMRSFENLVALANYQEALRDARKMVWRDRGEPAAEIDNIMECLEHAGRGGLRSAMLGFTLRSGFNVFVLLFRIWKAPKNFRFSLIRHAVLGPDSFRFAAMLGSFVAIYKFILNALPIFTPQLSKPPSPFDPSSSPPTPTDELPVTMAPTTGERKRGRLSFRAQAHEKWVRRATRRWHSILAGAVAGGISILFERKNRRLTIAQQLFVRGLQGSYNAFTARRGINIPYGDVLVFSLCCGQIMYAFLLRPDTIPRSYATWIQNASRAHPEAVQVNRSLVREGKFNIGDLENLIDVATTTAQNRTELLSMLDSARNFGEFGPQFGPCAAIHPWVSSCTDVPLDRFISVFKWMFPIYGALHFIPMILFKRKAFLEQPLYMLQRAGLGTVRSSAFLGVFVAIYQTFFCSKHNLYTFLSSSSKALKLPTELIDFLISKQSFWLGGFVAGLSLFVEEKRRRGELAMYVLPKGLESAWIMARGKGLVFHTGEFGEGILCAIGMGMVMTIYQNDPQHLSGLVRRILFQFIGPN